MVRWIRNFRPEYMISAKELRARLKLNSVRKFVQDRRLRRFGRLVKMEENV